MARQTVKQNGSRKVQLLYTGSEFIDFYQIQGNRPGKSNCYLIATIENVYNRNSGNFLKETFMNNQYISKGILHTALFTFILFCSCKKFVQIPPPVNEIVNPIP